MSSQLDLNKIRKTAMAKSKGFSKEIQEDFAQYAMIRIHEGATSKVSMLLVDFLREEFGRTRKDGTPNPKAALTLNPLQLTTENMPRSEQVHSLDYDRILSALSPEDRAYLTLQNKWGFTLQEIGDTFGVTEGRVSQVLTEVYKKLRKALAKPRPYRLKMEGKA